jgi:hypothetical protein
MGIDSLRLGHHPGGHSPEVLSDPLTSKAYLGCRFCRMERSSWASTTCPGAIKPVDRVGFDAEVERVKAQPARQMPSDAALLEAAGAFGCGCGQLVLTDRKTWREVGGVVHRVGFPCYAQGGSKQVGALSTARAFEQQPAPVSGERPVVPDLVALLEERRAFGARKYGTELHTHNGRDAYLDALQGLLDLFVYLHQAQLEGAQLREELAALRAENAALKSIAAAAQERVDLLLAASDARAQGGAP